MQYSTLFLAACMGLATTTSALKYPFSEVSQCGKNCIKEAITSSQAPKNSSCTPSHPACLCSEFGFGPSYEVIEQCVQKKCDNEAAKGVALDYFSESCVNQLISSALSSATAHHNLTHMPTAHHNHTHMPTLPGTLITSMKAPPSSLPTFSITAAPKPTSIVVRDPNFISDVASVVSDATSAVASVATQGASAVRSGVSAASSAAHQNAGGKKEVTLGVAALVAAGVGMAVVGV